MFLIFTSLPFRLNQGILYLLYGIVVILAFIGFHTLFASKIIRKKQESSKNRKVTSLIATISLVCAWIISYFLSIYTPLSHLYWIGLTVLVLMQSSQQKMLKNSLIRLGINALGALIVVILFSYIVPIIFWLNFVLLVVFLFLIFALGYSYIWRTLFIELFVLGFTHLLGGYQNIVALDRMVLTLLGGVIVIIVAGVSYLASGIQNKR